jgi:4-hydroxybenzoate polyprenyltransferase
MLAKLTKLLCMIKFSHTVFAMPFAVLATFLAADGGKGGFCGWGKLGLIVLCMVFARSVAMTFNRLADVKIDAANPRTAGREIVSGAICSKQAWLFLLACAAGFVLSTACFRIAYGNPWPLYLSVPVLGFICSYSYTKRFTWLCHFWLGASLMLSPVSAWVAVCPPEGQVVSAAALILGGAVLFWTAGFDIIYACQDVEVDRRDRLYSVPARLGVSTALWISRTCHSFAVMLFLLLYVEVGLGVVYYGAVLVVALLLVVEHLIVRGGRMKHITMAFATINGIISILLALAAILDILS